MILHPEPNALSDNVDIYDLFRRMVEETLWNDVQIVPGIVPGLYVENRISA